MRISTLLALSMILAIALAEPHDLTAATHIQSQTFNETAIRALSNALVRSNPLGRSTHWSLLDDGNLTAAHALAEVEDPAAHDALSEASKDEDPLVRRTAARALGRRN